MNTLPFSIEILYEDEDVLVINKPAGLLSIRDGYQKDLPYLSSLLEHDYGRLFIVHRLDKETSGVMVLARSPTSHKNLSTQFFQREIRKTYIALIIGCPETNFFSVDFPLLTNGDRHHRTIVDPVRGKPAHTDFTVIECYAAKYAQISAQPRTGYTHQIRSHLATAGFPILLDSLYSPKREPFLSLSQSQSGMPWIDRLALHASLISFLHPTTNQVLSFSASLPRDFLSATAIFRSLI